MHTSQWKRFHATEPLGPSAHGATGRDFAVTSQCKKFHATETLGPSAHLTVQEVSRDGASGAVCTRGYWPRYCSNLAVQEVSRDGDSGAFCTRGYWPRYCSNLAVQEVPRDRDWGLLHTGLLAAISQ
jgi:hypothetical protein